MHYTDIKTFEDACKLLKHDPATVIPDFSAVPEHHRKALIAHTKLVIVTEALNLDEEGKPYRPNWNNWDENKYYPWLEVETTEYRPSGFGFSNTLYDYSDTNTAVGSRLCSRTSDIARYAGKQFAELYKDYFLFSE